ncbi:hypothetical protein B7P43_G05899 [Cryptotermes secundus]|uniref:Cytoplasmic tRNA 2-thiolation protein 2 n=1 Tax=Cryptotermes secundus TaxID=105785 RepID=A0A2J7RIJ4_9NEOP|nr:cytoplasmic tRNA 2-thiolation protein 2-A isoform X2 [Cryptotermes secundus]PNF40658.1 hypothetical protein B7P43_G05899 [Cryptotermes secundus]
MVLNDGWKRNPVCWLETHAKSAGKGRLWLFSGFGTHTAEGAVVELSPYERNEICTSVIQQITKYNLPLYITTLERSLGNVDESCYYSHGDITYNIDDHKELQLKKLMGSIYSLTGKEDLLLKLRNQLLVKIAKRLKCTKIFSADTADHLAVKLLSSVALGRGAQLPLDIGFCDTRDPDVMLLRPMRDFMKKEVVFYNIFNKLESVFIPSLGTKANAHVSIQKLTETFVTDLQEDFPATVSTIFRTGDKLNMANSMTEAVEHCALCQAPVDTTTTVSSALQATEFSRMVSTLGPFRFDSKSIGTLSNAMSEPSDGEQKLLMSHKDKSDDAVKYCSTSGVTSTSRKKGTCREDGEGCQCSRNSLSITLPEVEACFCYSCRLIAREMATLEVLPAEVILNIKEQLKYKEMRKEIADFLL